MGRNKSSSLALLSYAALLATAPEVRADGWLGADQGKLLLTAGFSTVEGAGGGALTPWALISGYGSADSWGANVHATDLRLRDYELHSVGVTVGLLDKVELSASRQSIELNGTSLQGLQFSQRIFGVKVRLAGDALYAQDSWLPQIAVGALIKRHDGIDGSAKAGRGDLTSVMQLGAVDEDGVDYYLSATRLCLAHSVLVNATLRYSKANQLGLLGFGGDRENQYQPLLEATIGYLIRRQLVVGVEYRDKPDNLGVDGESAAWDAFIAWAPTRNVSVVAAYVNAGSILAPITSRAHDQDGAYVSVQFGF